MAFCARERHRGVAVGQRDRGVVLPGAERQRREMHPGLGGAHVVRPELAHEEIVGLGEVLGGGRRVAAQAEAPERQQRHPQPVVRRPHLGGDLGRRGPPPRPGRCAARRATAPPRSPSPRPSIPAGAAGAAARGPSGFIRVNTAGSTAATSCARHAALDVRLVERAQDQHVEGGGHAVEVVVVPDRVRQPVEVVRRAERLGDLLVQAVAHVLRRGVERQEDRRGPERLLVGPAQPLPLRGGAGSSASRSRPAR